MRYEKLLCELEGSKSALGQVIAIATEGDEETREAADQVLTSPRSRTPDAHPGGRALQLLAYHIAVRQGCDVDQPRNLAKSVTVE